MEWAAIDGLAELPANSVGVLDQRDVLGLSPVKGDLVLERYMKVCKGGEWRHCCRGGCGWGGLVLQVFGAGVGLMDSVHIRTSFGKERYGYRKS